MTPRSNADLAESWLQLWNGDLDHLDRIVADDIVVHAALIDGGDTLTGRAALDAWIAGLHAVMADLRFIIEVGPINDADHIALRWRARGIYRGGMPGVPEDSIGADIDFTGTDILRVDDCKLAEYWVNSDALLMMQQLGAIPRAAD